MTFLAACSLLVVGGAALRVHLPNETDQSVSAATQGQVQDDPPIDWERITKNARRSRKSVAPSNMTSPFVLHMHLNWGINYKSALWLLEETEICSSRNFMLCAVVSDSWARFPKWTSPFSALRPSATPRAPVKLVDCPANRDLVFWQFHGSLMYVCFAMTLQIAKQVGAEGVLVLADDSVVLVPWRSTIMPYLQTLGTTVMPFGGTDPDEKIDMIDPVPEFWMKRNGSLSNFSKSLEILSPTQKSVLGWNSTSHPVEKALADVMYIPTRQADEFQKYSDNCFKYRVFEEWCLGTVAKLLSGNESWLPRFPMQGRRIRWKERGHNSYMSIVNEELQKGEVTFVHPFKVSEKFPDNRAKVKELYREVFGS